MDSFLRHLISLAFLFVSVHFVNVGQKESIHIQKEIAPIVNQNQVTATTNGNDLNVDAFPQNRIRINTKALRRSKSSLNRRLYSFTDLMVSRLYMVCKDKVDSRNLAILNQPHSDYYLHILKRLRI